MIEIRVMMLIVRVMLEMKMSVKVMLVKVMLAMVK